MKRARVMKNKGLRPPPKKKFDQFSLRHQRRINHLRKVKESGKLALTLSRLRLEGGYNYNPCVGQLFRVIKVSN